MALDMFSLPPRMRFLFSYLYFPGSQKPSLQLAPAKSVSWYVQFDKEHSCVLLLILSLMWYYSSYFIIAEIQICCKLMNVPPNPKETPYYKVKVGRCWYYQSSTVHQRALLGVLLDKLSFSCGCAIESKQSRSPYFPLCSVCT